MNTQKLTSTRLALAAAGLLLVAEVGSKALAQTQTKEQIYGSELMTPLASHTVLVNN